MSDNNAQFKIEIVADAGSLVKESQKGGEALKGVAAAAAESAESTAKDGGAAEETAKKTSFLNLKKTELKKLVREIGREFPIAGMAAKAMMDPVVFSLTVAIGLFTKMKGVLDEWNKQMDEASARNASRDFLPGIEAKKEALKQAADSSAIFLRSLNQVATAEDNIAKAIQHSIDKLHEFVTAQAEINNAAEARDLAVIDLQQKEGKIGEVGAIEARATVRQRYRKMQDELKTNEENQELDLNRRKLSELRNAKPGLLQSEVAADKIYTQKKAEFDQAQKDFVEGEKKMAEYQTALEKSDDKLKAVKKRYDNYNEAVGWKSTTPNVQNAVYAELQQATGEKELALKAVENWQKTMADRRAKKDDTLGLKNAESDLQFARERVSLNRKTILDLEGEIPDRAEVNQIRQSGRKVVGGLNDQTEGLELRSQLQDKLNRDAEKKTQLEREVAALVTEGHGVKPEILTAISQVTGEIVQIKKELRALAAQPNNRL